MKSTGMASGTWAESRETDESLSDNGCIILIGIIGILMFVSAFLYMVIGNP